MWAIHKIDKETKFTNRIKESIKKEEALPCKMRKEGRIISERG